MNNNADAQFLNTVDRIFEEGTRQENRTGNDTFKIFGHMNVFDLREGFPLLTTKQLYTRAIFHELIWFFKGLTNIQYLKDNNVRIWDEWADENGELGPVYGAQWRNREDIKLAGDEHTANILKEQGYTLVGNMPEQGYHVYRRNIDQLGDAIERLKTNPDCRRIIVDAWNPAVLPIEGVHPTEQAALGRQALPPCHMMFHFNTTLMSVEERYAYFVYSRALELEVDNDWAHGAAERCLAGASPVRIQATDCAEAELQARISGELDHDAIDYGQAMVRVLDKENVPTRFLDLLLYQRSADTFLGVPFNIASYAAKLMAVAGHVGMAYRNFIHVTGDTHIYQDHIDQLQEQATRSHYRLPKLVIAKKDKLEDLTIDDFQLHDYQCHGVLKGKVSV